jgi:hypothetical protein
VAPGRLPGPGRGRMQAAGVVSGHHVQPGVFPQPRAWRISAFCFGSFVLEGGSEFLGAGAMGDQQYRRET